MNSFNKKLSKGIFSEEELLIIEEKNPGGMSSGEIVELFIKRGMKFSEATFRKYIQLGLLPRSRRVGSKGKHKGSKGIYPIGVVRQINEIKRMMGQDFTIDDIKQHLVFVGGEMEELRFLLDRIFTRLEENLEDEEHGSFSVAGLRKQVVQANEDSKVLVLNIERAVNSLRELRQLAREAV
jgi:hypothetical protein